MSSGEVRKVSRQDIQLVQNLIERCLQLYMSQKEVVNTLLDQAKIEPGFTELVWQKLEEENQEFFKAYYLRLLVKEQISRFNELLERQVELMRQMCPTGLSTVTMPNGSQISPMHQNSSCYATEQKVPAMKSENMQPIDGLPSTFANGGSSRHPCMQSAVDESSHATRIDAPVNMLLTQSTNVGMMQGMNGGMIKSEAGYVGNSPFIFGADGGVLGTRRAIGDTSVSSFGGTESSSQPLNETIMDADISTCGFLGQIPRNFSLSDLTAGFSNSSDILDGYVGSPFLAAETDNFLDPNARGENQGDIKRLDTISEGLSYDDFGSD